MFLWVEGLDDERFFNSIIKPLLEKKYEYVETRAYSTLKTVKIISFLKSMKSMKADYIFVTDIDRSPCITVKKQSLIEKLGTVEKDKIAVVIKEIESWYLAGLDDTTSKKIKIHNFKTTDSVTKEQFNEVFHGKFDSKIYLLSKVLEMFSQDEAKKKNKSFAYFVDKHCGQA